MDFLRQLSHDNTRLTGRFDKFDDINAEDFDSDGSDAENDNYFESQQCASTSSQKSTLSNNGSIDSGLIGSSQVIASSQSTSKFYSNDSDFEIIDMDSGVISSCQPITLKKSRW